MTFVALRDRLDKLNEEDRNTLREISRRCGDFPYSEKSASKLVRYGLASFIGGEAFITETGRRLLSEI